MATNIDNFITTVTLTKDMTTAQYSAVLQAAQGLSTATWKQLTKDIYHWSIAHTSGDYSSRRAVVRDIVTAVAKNESTTPIDVYTVVKAVGLYQDPTLSVSRLLSEILATHYPPWRAELKLVQAAFLGDPLPNDLQSRLIKQLLQRRKAIIPFIESNAPDEVAMEIAYWALGMTSMYQRTDPTQKRILDIVIQKGWPLPLFVEGSPHYDLPKLIKTYRPDLRGKLDKIVIWANPRCLRKAVALRKAHLNSGYLGEDITHLREQIPEYLAQLNLRDRNVQQDLLNTGNVTEEVLETFTVRLSTVYGKKHWTSNLSPALATAIEEVLAEDPSAERKAVKTIVRLAKKKLK